MLFTSFPILISLLWGLFIQGADAVQLEVGNEQSVCNAATLIIDGIMDYYLGTRYSGTVGMFQQPYYWWEAGLAFDSMIGTWKICNNDTYVEIIQDAINHQRGDNNNFMVANQSDVEANDDQVFWGFTVMEAAERNFPMYSDNEEDPSYAQLALNVYNSMAERWDTGDCDGGLRWQILSNMSGWDYKSTVSNAGLFAMASRLFRYTDDSDLLNSARRIFRWMRNVNFISKVKDAEYYNVYDGASINDHQCPVVNGAIWSYNYALMTMGTAYLYNATGDLAWENELNLLLGGIEHYFVNTSSPNVLYEYECNNWGKCNNDQRAFKAILVKSLGEIVSLVPNTQYSERALKIINASAAGAAQSCSGGSDGHTCGMNWAYDGWDGWYGLGEQIGALEVIQNTMIADVSEPCTEDTCGAKLNKDDSFETVPATTITTYVTQVSTNTKTEDITISSTSDVFYHL